MGPQTTASLRHLPRVAISTLIIVGCPALTVLALNASGLIASSLLLVAVGVALSIAASQAGAAYWKRRRGPEDLLFAELMVWGWLKRRRFERLLADAERLLGSRHGSVEGLDPSRRARLLERLSRSLETRDPYTHGHSRRVARHSVAIAGKMGASPEEVARIRSAAAIHDVGKIDIPVEILQKPGALSEEEYETIKGHSAAGARMAAPLGDAELTRIVRHHHERLDGKGYPDGLAGEEIPLGARIVAVADTFDALTSERPYRSAVAHRDALAVLDAEADIQLDAEAVRAFRRHYAGRGPVAAWAALLNGARQTIQPLIGGGAATAAQVTAASLATVALGSAALQPHDADRVAGKPPAGEPAAVRPAAFPRGADADSGDDYPHGRRKSPFSGGPDGDAAPGRGAGGGSAEAAGERSQPTPPAGEGQGGGRPTPGPSGPPATDPSPVDDVAGTVGKVHDEVVGSLPPLDPTLPSPPDVKVPSPGDLGLGDG